MASATQSLRLTNKRVRELLARISSREGAGALVERQDFDDLQGELASAAVWLQGVPPGSVPPEELTREISDYRASVEQLQQILPTIHKRLFSEKIRLETMRDHLAAVTEWASGSGSLLKSV